MLPLTTRLALRFGVIGGALAWVILNFEYLLVGTSAPARSCFAACSW